MKKLALSAAMIALCMSTSAVADTYRIATEGAYAPWNIINDEGKLVGFEIDLGHELCKRTGDTCEFITNEWDSLIPNLNAGNYDMVMAGMTVTDERKKSLAFSDEYFPADPSRYAAMKGTEVDFDNLKGKKIGVQGATIQASYAEENFAKDNTIKSYEKPDQSMADLASGNIDILLADATFLQTAVDGSQGAIVFVGPEVVIGGGIAIGMRQKDEALHEKMNKAIAEAKADGTVDKLILEYFKKGPFFSKAESTSEDKATEASSEEKKEPAKAE